MKIVGIVLLVILALILFLILAILFVPIRYRANGTAHSGKYEGQASASWFLHLLHVKASYHEDLKVQYGILWFQKDSLKEDDENSDLPQNEIRNKKKKMEAGNAAESLTIEEEEQGEKGPSTAQPTNVQEEAKSSGERSENSKKQKRPKKSSFREKWNSLKSKWNDIKHNYRKYKNMIEDARNQKAVSHLKKEVFHLLKVICPRKMKLQALFSTGAPDTTGELLGILACFPIMYKNRWKITPDFESEKAYVEGDTSFSGRIYLFHIVGIAFRLWRDKNVRRLYHKIMN